MKLLLLSSLLVALVNAGGYTCPIERGFCVKANGHDQNSGVIKLDSRPHYNNKDHQKACLKRCLARGGATGCEVIWHQGNRGCYVHTQQVSRGNGVGRHMCWIFRKCTVKKAPAPRPAPRKRHTGCSHLRSHLAISRCHAQRAKQQANKSRYHKRALGVHARAAKSITKWELKHLENKKRFLKLAKKARIKAKSNHRSFEKHKKKAAAAFKKHQAAYREHQAAYREYRKQTRLANADKSRANYWGRVANAENAKAKAHLRHAQRYGKSAKRSWELFKHHLKMAKHHDKKSSYHSEKELHHLGEHYMSGL